MLNKYIHWTRNERHTVWGNRIVYSIKLVDSKRATPQAILARLEPWGSARQDRVGHQYQDLYYVTLEPQKDKLFFRMLESWAEDMQRNDEMFGNVLPN